MATTSGITVPIKGDASGVTKATTQAEGAVSRMRSKVLGDLKGVAVGFAAGFGAQAIVKQLGASVTAASDLSETISKTQQVFGQSSADVLNWSRNSSNALGLSRTAALDAASTMAVFGKGAGLTGTQLNSFSTDLVGLSADFASFANTSPEDAVQAIGAALRGETEPIRRYGLVIDQASIQNEALRLGLIKTAKTPVTPQQKILATQALVKAFADGQKITGDFARTSTGLANQQRILAAKVDNARAAVGAGLVPAMLALINAGTSVVAAIQAVVGWLKRNMDIVKPLAVLLALLVINYTAIPAAIFLIATATKAWAVAQAFLSGALTPINLWIIGIAAVVALIIILWQRNQTFRDIVLAVWSVVGAYISTYVSIIKAVISGLVIAFQAVVAFFQQVPGWIGAAFGPLVDIITGPFRVSWAISSAVVNAGVAVVLAIVRAVPGLLSGALSILGAVISAPFRAAWALASAAVSAGRSAVLGIIGGISGAVSSALSGVANAFAAPFRAAQALVQGIVDTISRIAGGVRAVVDTGIGAAKSLYNGFASTWNSIQITLPEVKIPLGPTIGGGSIGLPDLPRLARGGYVTGPTLALIGEGRAGGRAVPEIVAPEPMLRRLIRAETGAAAQPSVQVTINVPAAANPAEVGRILVDHIRSYEQAAGAGWRVRTA